MSGPPTEGSAEAGAGAEAGACQGRGSVGHVRGAY